MNIEHSKTLNSDIKTFVLKKNISRLLLAIVAILAAWYFYHSRQPRFSSGEMAPECVIAVAGQAPLKLSDLRGRPVLLHFWGTWCGPCRAENPELVKLYNEFHSKGFEIVSIAIERNSEAAWKSVIQSEGMKWPYHAIESGRFDGPMATLFNVHAIPATLLIDASGQIIATNPSPLVLGKILSEQTLTN